MMGPPSPSETGWGSLPISGEAATSLFVTCRADASEVSKIDTHSCKVTTLSWAAKAGHSKRNETYTWVSLSQRICFGVTP